jgi:MYXO-CTERM domain-containing protein
MRKVAGPVSTAFATPLALAAVLLVMLLSRSAAAGLTLVEPIERSAEHHTIRPFDISRQDCESDETFTFTFAVTPEGNGDVFQVWITDGNVDCSLQDNRDQDGQCTQIGDGEPRDKMESFDLVLATSDIANAVPEINGCVDPGASSNGRSLFVYFLLVSGSSDAAAGNSAVWETVVDLVGPAPPTNLTAGVGDETFLVVSFDSSTSTDIAGYNAYCSTALSASGAGGATASSSSSASSSTSGAGGAGGAGGVAASSSSSSSAGSAGGSGAAADCAAADFAAGDDPPTALLCGSTQQQSTSVDATVPTGVISVVAVAGFDDLGNVGPLSELSCGEPEPTDDFFDIYKGSGGPGGGGYCNCTVVGAPDVARHAAWLGLAALVALGWRRRRRERR